MASMIALMWSRLDSMITLRDLMRVLKALMKGQVKIHMR